MAKYDLGLSGYNSIFSTEQERNENANTEKVVSIPIESISDFKGHPFHVSMDDDMVKLIDSVKENGLLMPALVRPSKDGNGYEMIAGHRRKFALQQLTIKEINAIVRDIDDDQATILMVDSNIQRENILPTERGKAYKMRLEAMKHQGKVFGDISEDVTLKYNKSTSAQVGPKLGYFSRSNEELAAQLGISRNQIKRFIRLTFLIEPLQQMVDGRYEDKRFVIAFNPGVELSFLKENEQESLVEMIKEFDATPSLTQAQQFKQASKDGVLDESYIRGVLSIEKPNQREPRPIDWNKYNKYFPKNYTQEQKEQLVDKLLGAWAKKREKGHER